MLILLTRCSYYIARETCLMAYHVFWREPWQSLECLFVDNCYPYDDATMLEYGYCRGTDSPLGTVDSCTAFTRDSRATQADSKQPIAQNQPHSSQRSHNLGHASQPVSGRGSSASMRLYHPTDMQPFISSAPSSRTTENVIGQRDRSIEAVPRTTSQPTNTDLRMESKASMTNQSFPNPDQYVETQGKASQTELRRPPVRHSHAQVSTDTKDAASRAEMGGPSVRHSHAEVSSETKDAASLAATDAPTPVGSTTSTLRPLQIHGSSETEQTNLISPVTGTTPEPTQRISRAAKAAWSEVNSQNDNRFSTTGVSPVTQTAVPTVAASVIRSSRTIRADETEENVGRAKNIGGTHENSLDVTPVEPCTTGPDCRTSMLENDFLNQVASELKSASVRSPHSRHGRIAISDPSQPTTRHSSISSNMNQDDRLESPSSNNWSENLPENLKDWLWISAYAAIFLFLILHLVFIGYHYTALQKIRNTRIVADTANFLSNETSVDKSYIGKSKLTTQKMHSEGQFQDGRSNKENDWKVPRFPDDQINSNDFQAVVNSESVPEPCSTGQQLRQYDRRNQELNIRSLNENGKLVVSGSDESDFRGTGDKKCAKSPCQHKTFEYYDCMHEHEKSSIENCIHIA